jgi:hypothetical protein
MTDTKDQDAQPNDRPYHIFSYDTHLFTHLCTTFLQTDSRLLTLLARSRTRRLQKRFYVRDCFETRDIGIGTTALFTCHGFMYPYYVNN